jgi:ribosomal protein S8
LNAKANVTDLTTTNVIEGNNLYYTNSRVYSNVLSILATYTGNIAAGNVTIGSGASGGTITGANVISTNTIIASIWTGIYTANVIETSGNLYFTNARVYANVVSLLAVKANVTDLTTANVAELNNLYYTNARVYSNVIGLLNAKANVVDLTTSNVVEGNNLYYTNARVYSNVIALLPTYTGNVGAGNVNIGGTQGGFITGANVISTNTIIASIWTGIHTANVIESPSALYYNNTRVYANVIALLQTLAGNNIIIVEIISNK